MHFGEMFGNFALQINEAQTKPKSAEISSKLLLRRFSALSSFSSSPHQNCQEN